jgi:hypothetical protein
MGTNGVHPGGEVVGKLAAKFSQGGGNGQWHAGLLFYPFQQDTVKPQFS